MYQLMQQINQILEVIKETFMPLIIAGIVLIPLEMLFQISHNNRIKKSNSFIDILFLLSNSLVANIPFTIAIWISSYLIYILFAKANFLNGFGFVSLLPIGVSFILIAVIHDFINYWIHYALHHTRLWKIHAVHHSSEKINFLSALRTHFLELFIQLSIRTVILLLLGFSLSMVLTYEAVFGFIGLLIHSNVRLSFGPFKYVFVSPIFHHWHHATNKEAINKNFALVFSFWDYLFNTHYCPEEMSKGYGLKEKISPSFFGLLFYPFKKLSR